MERHRLDTDPDPDRLYILTIRIRILPRVLHMLENHNIFLLTQFILFFFLFSVMGVIIFNILDSKLKFSENKFSLALHLTEMNTDPEPQK